MFDLSHFNRKGYLKFFYQRKSVWKKFNHAYDICTKHILFVQNQARVELINEIFGIIISMFCIIVDGNAMQFSPEHELSIVFGKLHSFFECSRQQCTSYGTSLNNY